MSRTPTEKNPKMGLRISQLRAERKMTQEELGAVIGVQRSAVRKYEKGEVVNLPASSIKKLSDCFEVDPCYLLGWTDEKECKGLNKTGGGGNMENTTSIPDQLKGILDESVIRLLNAFANLNDEKREKAINHVENMTKGDSQ